VPFKGEPTEAPAWLPERVQAAWNLGAKGIRKTKRRAQTARRIDPGRRLGMEWEPVDLFTDDGVGLAGWWVIPESPRPDGLVAVMHHHYGGQRATMLPWIHLFWRLGIPSLSFDARGHGDSHPTPVGRGSFPKRRADVHAAIAEARRRGARRILGFGQSQGAATLAMALGSRTPPELVGLILDSGPAPDMSTAAWGLSGNILGRGKDDLLARSMLSARILPGTEPHIYPLVLWSSLLRLTRQPLLWLHGDDDDVIERDWALTWWRPLSPLSRSRWRSVLVPGADHVRTLQTAPDHVEEEVGNFLARLES